MKWKKKADIKPAVHIQFPQADLNNQRMITLACEILQVLSKGKVQKHALRNKRHAHVAYDDLSQLQRRERVMEALFYNAAQTANLPSESTLLSVFDETILQEQMKPHWQPIQGLIIFDSGKIRKTKAKTTSTASNRRVKKPKDYLPVLYEMVYDLLLNGTRPMSTEMITSIAVDNYGMPDKHAKEIREECVKTINKIRKVLSEF